jgi:hypothetical protein
LVLLVVLDVVILYPFSYQAFLEAKVKEVPYYICLC